MPVAHLDPLRICELGGPLALFLSRLLNLIMVAPSFRINVCNARHELDLLRAIIKEHKSFNEVHIKEADAELTWLHPGSQEYSKS